MFFLGKPRHIAHISINNHQYLPVVPARGGAEVALGIYIYKTFLIYRTCMRRAPAKPVRAPVFHFALHTSHCTLHTPHFTFHTSHYTVHTSHCTLRIPHFTLHTSQSTLHTSRTRPRTVVVVSKNMTCAQPRCNATSSKQLPHI